MTTDETVDETALVDKQPHQMNRNELLAYTKKLKAEQEAALAAKEVELAELQGLKMQQAGWLVTTPNPLFGEKPGEKVIGITFERGQAFIPLTRRFPEFEHKLPKEEYFTNLNYKPAEIETVKKNAAKPSSQVVAEKLRDDFHYDVRFFGPDDWGQVENLMNVRASEYRVAADRLKREQDAHQLMRG